MISSVYFAFRAFFFKAPGVDDSEAWGTSWLPEAVPRM
jgi:hypothetical protein